MTLNDGMVGEEYIISKVNTGDEELKGFLFSLGCYPNERITLLDKKKRNLVVAIKNGRYSIDSELGESIEI